MTRIEKGAPATFGLSVSGFASTEYNVAVGGTDFGDTYAGTSGTYWSSTNGTTYGSALSYIPEVPWNDSCASELLAGFLGFSSTYGSSGLCNSIDAEAFPILVAVDGGSGGPSSCATGAPSISGVVSGSCAGWPKPSYQSVFGNPSDGVRDLPDVSLFAADGLLGHCYVFCDSHNASCSWRSQHVALRGRDLVRLAHNGRHSGAGGSDHWKQPGESKSLLLLPRPHRVWRGRQLFLQLDARQWRGQFLHLPRRNPGRHGRALHYRRP